jgi:hypothetical protein
MLEAKQINSRTTLESFSIRVWKEGAFLKKFKIFKLMDMEKLNASLSNQWPLNWFKTQIVTAGEKLLTIIWQMC